MVSILIPTYNTDCVPLAQMIKKMADRAHVPYEIVVGDDASFEGFRERNAYIATWPECRYLQREHNGGAAVMRNFLADNAQYSYLLFLDADTMPVREDFLEQYIETARPGCVVCGGFDYPPQTPSGSELRYKYGREVEMPGVANRYRSPYKNFNSMNFMIHRETFQKIRFDESFHVGYEDTVFGLELEKAGIAITEIDNPVHHMVEEPTKVFLRKVECAIDNLKHKESTLHDDIRILQVYERLKHRHLTGITALAFRLTRPLVERNLTSHNPSLKLFAFFKLGVICGG